MTVHTPGKWHKDIFSVFGEGGRGLIARETSSGRSLAERAANARLIAAAPELLQALENLVACDLWQDRPEMQAAKEAIKKAKGEL